MRLVSFFVVRLYLLTILSLPLVVSSVREPVCIFHSSGWYGTHYCGAFEWPEQRFAPHKFFIATTSDSAITNATILYSGTSHTNRLIH